MAFTRPTLTQIKDRIESDFKSGLGLPTLLRRSFLKVFAAAFAGASHTLHGHIQDFMVKQFFPDMADDEYLVRWARIFGIERLDATFAEINITITGVAGAVVPVNRVYQRSDGFEYTLKAEVIIGVGGSSTGVIVASESGSEGNISDGSTVNLTSPIVNVDSEATVDSTAIEGEDQETIEALRTRLLQRIQQPPAGGKVSDYIAFALQVVGVTRVWVLPNQLGQGTVGVTFVEDNEDPIIPSAAKVDEVQEAIDEQKPVTADVIVFAPNDDAVDMQIQIKPNTQDVRDNVLAELTDLFFREAQVRNAVDPDRVGEGVTLDGKIPLSKINEAISIASGEEDHVLLTPTSDPQASEAGLLSLGTVTFSTLP